jgi:uncharacterized protein
MLRPPRFVDDDGDAEKPRLPRAEGLRRTRAVLQDADRAFSGYSCPASAECCQLAKTQKLPWLWPSEWAVLEARLEKDHRLPVSPRPDGACPLLDESGKRCTVYEDRPFGCRTFFCDKAQGPKRAPIEQADALQKALKGLSVELDDGAYEPRTILDWLLDPRTDPQRQGPDP